MNQRLLLFELWLLLMCAGLSNSQVVCADRLHAGARIELRGESTERWSHTVFEKFPESNAVLISEAGRELDSIYLLSAISEVKGVSSYIMERVFLSRADHGTVWEKTITAERSEYAESRVEFMGLGLGEDVDYRDPRFVQVRDVGVEEFRTLMSAWKKILVDQQSRDRAFKGISFFRRMLNEVKSLKSALNGSGDLCVDGLHKMHQGGGMTEGYYLFVTNNKYSWRLELNVNRGNVVIVEVAVGHAGSR